MIVFTYNGSKMVLITLPVNGWFFLPTIPTKYFCLLTTTLKVGLSVNLNIYVF